MTEIERKFRVKSTDFKKEAFKKSEIRQGFLNTHPERTVRLRLIDDQAFLTIKGKSSKDGLSRFEWEKEISTNDGEKLLEICEPGKIEKIRYFVKWENFVFEVDEFLGENEGLIIAEVELESETDTFTKPSWLGEEVTGDNNFYNSQLSKNPFKNWKNP